jgi:hypothetical protein
MPGNSAELSGRDESRRSNADQEPSMEFEIVCPNNHNQTVSFTSVEFQAAVKAGLQFHCNTCESNWTPTQDQIAAMRQEFDEAQ